MSPSHEAAISRRFASAGLDPPPASRDAPSAPVPARHPDLPWRLPWRAVSLRPGAHRGRFAGAGGLFLGHASLLAHPDPRRLDLRATLRDPFEILHVRRFEQKSAITVHALIDVSGSMAFGGKMRLAAELAAAIAASARRAGDRFGLMGCARGIEPGLDVPASRARSGETRMAERLRAWTPAGCGTAGFLEAARRLSGARKLVFVISDFHMPPEDLRRLFEVLAIHDTVPLALRSSRESEALPRWGFLALSDLETGQKRLVVLRPSFREAWQRQEAARRAALAAAAARAGARPPFEIVDRIPWDRLASHLAGSGP